jgi:catechol 2,3-dioxygenase-like lactoylglutathione lyase family enzyme
VSSARLADVVLGVQAISVLGKHVKSGNGTLRLIVFMGTATYAALTLSGAPGARSAVAVLRGDPAFSDFGGLRMSRTCNRLRPRGISGHHRSHEKEGETGMAIRRMDNVGIVVEDMDAAIAFFVELGMELEGRAEVEGSVADQCTGLDGVRCDIAMVRTPDGQSRLELAKYRSPAVISAEPRNRPHNILGTHRVMFAVDDIEDTVARLRPHGAELVGEIARFEDSYLLCHLRGPEGIIIGLAEQLR